MEPTLKDVVVRTATMADIDGLVASGSALFIEDGVARDRLRNPGWPQEHALDYEKGTLADPNVLVLVAEHHGTVLGHLTGVFYAGSVMWTAPRAHLISLNVLTPWRGQKVGAQLVEQFRTWAKDRGAVQLRVTAYAANEDAIRFYRRHGFAPLESTLAADL
jgi:GNAT superfamily N-acetyltransferase